MKTQIKDIVIGIFAVIGFTAVVMGFTNQTEPQQTYGTPESHVWEAYGTEGNWGWMLNKQTGEIYGLDADKKAKVIVGTLDKSK
jgi:hypothetical protein